MGSARADGVGSSRANETDVGGVNELGRQGGEAISAHVAERLIRTLAFTLVLSVMSATMFNVVLAEISAEFQLSLAQVSWVSSAYMLTYAIGAAIYGRLADTYRLKHLLTFGLGVLALGSIVGLAAQVYWMLLLGRVLQSVGAAVIPATAMIIPVRYFPPERRGRALGISATGLALGAALGPVVSGLVAGAVHWRWLFLVPLLTLCTLPFYRKWLDERPGEVGAIDWLGGGLLAGTAGLLLLAVTYGNGVFALGGTILFALFVVRIRSAAVPFVEPSLFQNRRYALSLMIAFLASSNGYALPFLSPLLLANVHRLEPGLIGFALVPAAVAQAFLSRKGGSLADAKGNSFLFYVACALLLTCFVLLSFLAGRSPTWFASLLVFGNVGLAFMQIAMSNAISQTLPKDQTGVGMGLFSMMNFIAGALAAGVYGKVIDLNTTFRWNPVRLHPDTLAYSYIYFVLALLSVGTLALYHFRFDKASRTRRKIVPHGSA